MRPCCERSEKHTSQSQSFDYLKKTTQKTVVCTKTDILLAFLEATMFNKSRPPIKYAAFLLVEITLDLLACCETTEKKQLVYSDI